MDLEAVAFDVDGTLYPNYRMYFNSLAFGLRKPHLIYHFSAVRSLIRRIRPIHDFRRLQAELLAERMRISSDEAYDLIEHWVYSRWESSLSRIRPFRHVREMLAELKAAGLKLGVVSDYPVVKKLVYLDLGIEWHCAFSSEETGYLKPNPEPFMEMARRLETPPDRILYVGNSYQYDVLGARGVGMQTAHLSARRVPGSMADITFSDFRQLTDGVLGRIRS